jgi:predicted DNA-binding protein
MAKDEQVSVRLSAEQRAKLEKLAEQDDRTLSSTIRRIVTRALSQGEGVAASPAKKFLHPTTLHWR